MRLTFDEIQGADDFVQEVPWIGTLCAFLPACFFYFAPVHHHKTFVELILHFALPLHTEGCGTHNKDPFISMTENQFFDDKTRFDGFPESHFISQEKPGVERIDDTVRGFYLMRKNLGPGV